jgi:hypothetical protein
MREVKTRLDQKEGELRSIDELSTKLCNKIKEITQDEVC